MQLNKYVGQTTMIDILMNLLLMISALLILLLMILKSDIASPAIDNLNKYVITMEWTKTSSSDIDLWVLDPADNVVGYRRKEGNGMFLQRDDLGKSNDYIVRADGSTEVAEVNNEIVNIRQWQPGRYHVNAHAYSIDEDDAPFTVVVKLFQVTPYAEYVTKEFTLARAGAEKTLLTFELDVNGNVTLMPEVQYLFVTRKRNQHLDASGLLLEYENNLPVGGADDE